MWYAISLYLTTISWLSLIGYGLPAAYRVYTHKTVTMDWIRFALMIAALAAFNSLVWRGALWHPAGTTVDGINNLLRFVANLWFLRIVHLKTKGLLP